MTEREDLEADLRDRERTSERLQQVRRDQCHAQLRLERLMSTHLKKQVWFEWIFKSLRSRKLYLQESFSIVVSDSVPLTLHTFKEIEFTPNSKT